MNTTSQPQNGATDQVQPYLSVQMTYTTQPLGGHGPSDYELVTNALTYYQTSLVRSLDNCLDTAQKDRVIQRIGMVGDQLFDLKMALIWADQERVEQERQSSGSDFKRDSESLLK